MSAIPLPTPELPAAPAATWRHGPGQWGLLLLAVAALVACNGSALAFMVATWRTVEEYSYGWFVPVISAFLVWQRSDRLRLLELRGSWWGLPLIALSLLLGAVGELSAIRSIGQYGFVIGLVGLSLASVGVRGTRLLAVPLAVLLFMIPLPQFILREVSQSLQLVSSQLGVGLIRSLGISVFLEGNVIDLGSYKLQVVEACNGLRYLFPLMVLGFLAAYFYRGPMWQRVLVVLSTVPLTIVINSLRIGLIGVTVEHWGVHMAEGLLHDIEGFFMFMICLALLLGEMALLARLDPQRRGLRGLLVMEWPEPAPASAQPKRRRAAGSMLVAALLLAVTAAMTLALPSRESQLPARQPFAAFPMELAGGWRGQPDRIAPDVLAALALDDYLVANFVRPGGPWVNVYSAWYNSQSGGQSSHSPRTCIPGDGWAILSLERTAVALGRVRVPVNRAVIQKGEVRQLAYFWFPQRGRLLTDEYEVKWLILRDALVQGRTDGALMRLITPISPAEAPAAADARLVAFMEALQPLLKKHIPD